MKHSHQATLSGAEEFGAVFASPSVSKDSCFRMLSRPNELTFSRLGMAVSRRTCRLAVGRNRIKRIIRESFRHHQAGFAGPAARDFVVLPTPEAASISNAELFESLRTHWRKQEKLAHNAAQRAGGPREARGK